MQLKSLYLRLILYDKKFGIFSGRILGWEKAYLKLYGKETVISMLCFMYFYAFKHTLWGEKLQGWLCFYWEYNTYFVNKMIGTAHVR